ncbi:MAG: single-stranded DNA-binding protein [Clostridia bacterium]|nr:single-stranded DNA-binding protein [Clostridia bacterium]
MLNSAIIMGRLVADPELRTTQNGVSVTSFAVAVQRNFASANGEKQTDFINVVAWRNQAEFVTKYFKKGQMIAIRGSIQTRRYEDKATGAKRTAFEIVAGEISFCGGKSENEPKTNYSNPEYNQAPPASNNMDDFSNNDFATLDEDEDLPF